MNRILLSVFFIMIIGFAGCNQLNQAVTENSYNEAVSIPPIPSLFNPIASQTPFVSPSVLPSPTITPSPSFAPATDIPDIINDTDETIANSFYFLYEDGDYIYYSVSNQLCQINKLTGNIKQINDNNWICFTVCKGMVYYTESIKPNGSLCNVVKSYDPSTNKKNTVETLKYNIEDLVAYGDKLYLTCCKNDDSYNDLYVMNPDGTDLKRIIYDVFQFCIYKNRIYYTDSSLEDGTPVNECGLDGSGKKQIIDWIEGYFDIGDNRLFYEGPNMAGAESGYIDLNTGESTDMEYDQFAPFGHYLIYNNHIGLGDKETCYFYLYDFENGQTTYLTQLNNILVPGCCFLPTKDNIYYDVENKGSSDLYRLVIEDGKASMELVLSDIGAPAETPPPQQTPSITPVPPGAIPVD